MSNFTSNRILLALQKYMDQEGWLEKASKANPDFAIAIHSISAQDIHIKRGPVFMQGVVEGNATATGEKTYGDTTSRRTVSIDFSTEEYLFIGNNNTAPIDVCKRASKMYMGSSNAVYKQCEAETLAEKYGKKICRRNLNDLDFSMKEYRLNRYKLVETFKDYEVDYHPVYAHLKMRGGKEEDYLIGYCYRKNGQEYIDIDFNVPLTAKQKFIIWGIIAAIIVGIIALFSIF